LTDVLKIKPNQVSFKALGLAAEVLLAGGIIAGPTQSFYALMALADKPMALERLWALKSGRDQSQAFLLLLDRPERVVSYASEIKPAAKLLMESFWPGLLTLLFTAHNGLHPSLLGGKTKTVALRMEGLELVRKLIRLVDRAVTGTSANPHGQWPSSTAEETLAYFGGLIDLIIDFGPTGGRDYSTIIDTSGDQPLIVRDGAVSIEDLRLVCPEILV
jgi:L-threonylcarbamoyladenylate synthase